MYFELKCCCNKHKNKKNIFIKKMCYLPISLEPKFIKLLEKKCIVSRLLIFCVPPISLNVLPIGTYRTTKLF